MGYPEIVYYLGEEAVDGEALPCARKTAEWGSDAEWDSLILASRHENYLD